MGSLLRKRNFIAVDVGVCYKFLLVLFTLVGFTIDEINMQIYIVEYIMCIALQIFISLSFICQTDKCEHTAYVDLLKVGPILFIIEPKCTWR